MRANLQKMHQQRDELLAQMEGLVNAANGEDRSLTADEQTQFDQLKAKVDTLDKRIENESALLDARDRTPGRTDTATAATDSAEASAGMPRPAPKIEFGSYRGTMRVFKDAFNGRSAEERAFRFGMWLRAIAGKSGAQRYCKDFGLQLNQVQEGNVQIGATYTEGDNTAGGYLVLPEFDRDIIRLVVQYGKFRQNCRVSPMGSDTKERDRRTGGLTAYFAGEGDAGTESTGAWDRVQLIAKKLMVLTRVSNELNSDAIISMADNIAEEVALAFATKEDQCGFVGDGTSTYGGIVGVSPKLKLVNSTDEGGGQIVATGNLFSEVVLGDFNKVIGILPDYPGIEENAAWYCSKYFFAGVMQRLEAAAGGNSWVTMENGSRRRVFLGYPVVTTETMPKTDANSQIIAMFGDLRLAADLGDRAQITIAMSDSASVGGQSVFERDQLAFRATERFDINVHDVGDATTAGPIVSLMSAAS